MFTVPLHTIYILISKENVSNTVTHENVVRQLPKNLSVQAPVILLCAASSSVPRLLPPTILTALANKRSPVA